MSTLAWIIVILAAVNLLLFVLCLTQPGRPERNTLAWSERQR